MKESLIHDRTNILIGYWRNVFSAPDLPIPIADSATPEEVRIMLERLDLLIRRASVREHGGNSICRICNCENGSSDYTVVLHHKKIVFPYGLRHYIEHHGVVVKELLSPL